jgi:hypothetical protein
LRKAGKNFGSTSLGAQIHKLTTKKSLSYKPTAIFSLRGVVTL